MSDEFAGRTLEQLKACEPQVDQIGPECVAAAIAIKLIDAVSLPPTIGIPLLTILGSWLICSLWKNRKQQLLRRWDEAIMCARE